MHPLTIQKQERQMKILCLIKRLRFATQRHLMCVIDMGGVRNANRILNEMKRYLSVYIYKKEKVYYLNREGRAMLDDAEKVVPSIRMGHHMMRNEAWLHCYCPDDWVIEKQLRYTKGGKELYIMTDAAYTSERVLHCVEVDRTQAMRKNEEKIKRYAEYGELYKRKTGKVLVVRFFTITSYRKERLEQLTDKYHVYAQVYLIPEV